MKVAFSCPSCGAPGSAGEAFAGRQVRCRHCRHEFAIPKAGEAEGDGYDLDRPPPAGAAPGPMPPSGSVYAPARDDRTAPSTRIRPRKPAATRPPRRERPGIAWGAWLVRGGLAFATVLAVIAVAVPGGLATSGLALMALGLFLVVLGFGAGAYGAFSEDLLYGILYLLIPLYSAYYLVTRWDDLGRWFACSTAGVGLILVGTWLLRWAGVEA